MDKVDQSRVFVRVAEMESFIKAAHVLKLPRATVSAAIQHPDDLSKGHISVGYASDISSNESAWEYHLAGVEQALRLPSNIIVNNAENYIACCCAGLGLIQVPLFDVQHLIDSGQLVEVMSRYRPAPMDVSALYPDRRQRSLRLDVFIEWFEGLISPYLEQRLSRQNA
ncbi:LysR family transcriptional regulator [Pseudomonas sp. 15FMM2]|uniref:LysR family transcriptional regulator n=1 Tax=Pseudomonas imrae TaxID=2992837 RepID=A0ACC7PDR4_9PSED